jgi:predicted house-cleaning noncanonical NTP pyrophosphatase (MazG superfamily)
MPRFQTKLLIRDGRVAAFAAQGATLEYRTLSDAEFDRELRRKLAEEAAEAATAPAAKLCRELADVLEIMQALAGHHGVTMAAIEAARAATRAKLGGFDQRIYSEAIAAPEGHETTTYHRQYPQKYPEIDNA